MGSRRTQLSNKTLTLCATLFVALATGLAAAARADEGGVSFWQPGQYASFAAIAPDSGWSLPMQAYTYSGSVDRDRALSLGGDLVFGLDTDFSALFIVPTYTFDGKLFGATPSLSVAVFPGYNDTSVDLSVGSRGFTYNFENPDTDYQRHRLPSRRRRVPFSQREILSRRGRLRLRAVHARRWPAAGTQRL